MGTVIVFTGSLLVLTVLFHARPVIPQACSGTSYLYASGVQDKILASPNYPSQYTNNLDCTWIISTSSGQQINISFSTLELESCCDFVEIRDGQYSSSRLLAKYSGSKSAFSFVSSGTKLRIRFTTDGSNTRQGFRASYRASAMLPTTAPTVWGTAPYYSNMCSGTRTLYPYRGLRYTLQSPGYPSAYPNNLDCTWIISAPAGYYVRISFTTFRTEQTVDYVEIRNGQYSYSFLRGRYSGVKGPFSLTSTGSKLRIRFVTDLSATNQGFHASYEAVNTPYFTGYPVTHPWYTTPSSNNCFGGVQILRDKSGSFGYNINIVQVTCRWLIVVPNSYKVRLHIEPLAHCRSSCSSYGNCDSVSVYEGPSEANSKKLGVYCGHDMPPPIYAEGYIMLVVFKASYYGVHVFKASYESVRLTPKEEKLTIALSVVGGCFFFILIISLCFCCKRKEQPVRQQTSPPTFSGLQSTGVQFYPPTHRAELVRLPEESETTAPAPTETPRTEDIGQVTEALDPQLNNPDEAPPPYQPVS